jgi:hypothetical protein
VTRKLIKIENADNLADSGRSDLLTNWMIANGLAGVCRTGLECDMVRPVCASVAGRTRYFIFAHCRAATERFSSICCARSIALIS